MKRSKALLQKNINQFKRYKKMADEMADIKDRLTNLNAIPLNEISFEDYTLKRNLQQYYEFKQYRAKPDSTLESDNISKIIHYEIVEKVEADEELNRLCAKMETTQTDESESEYHEALEAFYQTEYAKIQPMIDELKSYLGVSQSKILEYSLKKHKAKLPTKTTLSGLADLKREIDRTGFYKESEVTSQLISYKYGVETRKN